MRGGGGEMPGTRTTTAALHGCRALLACVALALALVLAHGARAGAGAQGTGPRLPRRGDDPTTEPGVDGASRRSAPRRAASPSRRTDDARGDHRRRARARRPRASCSSTPPATCSTTEQEAALESFVDDGGGFLGIGSAAQSEPGTEFFDGLIGARPDADSSTDADRADASSSATRCIPPRASSTCCS